MANLRILFCAIVITISAFGQSIHGELERVYTVNENGELRYRCLAQGKAGPLKIEVVLQTTTNVLIAELDKDVRIKGVASETLDRKTGTTYYFVQGGSAPYLQRLTLATRAGGKWARFTKTYGADEFVCE